MKFAPTSIYFLLMISLVSAETIFFDNPDDTFIMGEYTTSGLIGGTTGETTGSGGDCTYKWNCTNWSECLPTEKQTRTCTNVGTCSNKYKNPEAEQTCTYTTPEVEGEVQQKSPATLKVIAIITVIIIVIILMVCIYYYIKKSKKLTFFTL